MRHVPDGMKRRERRVADVLLNLRFALHGRSRCGFVSEALCKGLRLQDSAREGQPPNQRWKILGDFGEIRIDDRRSVGIAAGEGH